MEIVIAAIWTGLGLAAVAIDWDRFEWDPHAIAGAVFMGPVTLALVIVERLFYR